MKQSDFRLILLYDLSEKIEESFRFIQHFSKNISLHITILHIIDKEQEAAINKQQISMECYCQNIHQHFQTLPSLPNVTWEVSIEKGNIFDTIPLIAKESQADLILFNTPGLTIFQERSVSNAFRLINKADTPVVIVHSPAPAKMDQIVSNTTCKIDQFNALFDLPFRQIDNLSPQNFIDNSLIVYEIPKSAFSQKEKQKAIEKIIFNEQHLPVICWKSEL